MMLMKVEEAYRIKKINKLWLTFQNKNSSLTILVQVEQQMTTLLSL